MKQVDSIESLINVDDKDKARIKSAMHSLLDNLDQSSGIEMNYMQDPETGTPLSEQEMLSIRKVFVEDQRDAQLFTMNDKGFPELEYATESLDA